MENCAKLNKPPSPTPLNVFISPPGGLREDLQYKKSPWNLYSLKYQLVIIWLEILQGYYYGKINTKYKSAVQYSTKKQVRFKKLILNNIVHTSWIVGSGNWVTVCWEIKFFHYAIIRKKTMFNKTSVRLKWLHKYLLLRIDFLQWTRFLNSDVTSF